MKSKAVMNMAKALAPAMLRIGGILEDFVTFKHQAENDDTVNRHTMNSPHTEQSLRSLC